MPEWFAFLLGVLLLHSSRSGSASGNLENMNTTTSIGDSLSSKEAGPPMGRWMPGPYEYDVLEAVVDLPQEGAARRVMRGNNMTIYVTYPVALSGTEDGEKSDEPVAMPVLIFYNGFQGMASWYRDTVQGMASWGYVCLQYNLPSLSMVGVADEEELFPVMNEWIQNGGLADVLDGTGDSPAAFGYVDGSRLVVGGHSRGGKVAGLLFAENDDIKAAWLVDPVDTSQFAPVSEKNPGAVLALKKSGKKIGVAGASILSSCNPTEGNYEAFYDAGAAGSWKVLMNETSHSQFSDAGAVTNRLQDGLCGKGEVTRQYVQDTMATCMLSWFWENLNEMLSNKEKAEAPLAPPWDPLPQFYEWIGGQSRQKRLEFEVKL